MNERPVADSHDDQNDDLGLTLSALMDGECSAAEAEALCRRWPAETAVRSDWHAYQLIGDVLRSDELAGSARDASFLTSLRQRLADEPRILAPEELAPAAAPSRRRALPRWAAPMGMAAGVALVASAVWVTRPDAGGLAAPADNARLAVAASPGPAGTAPAISSPTTRDARAADVAQFERYLFAHKQFQPAASLNPASGYLRSAVYESNER